MIGHNFIWKVYGSLICKYFSLLLCFVLFCRIPGKTYMIIAFLTVGTMGLSNTSLGYLNYPTQVIFKCCKLIPVMIGGVFIQGKLILVQMQLQKYAFMCWNRGLGSGIWSPAFLFPVIPQSPRCFLFLSDMRLFKRESGNQSGPRPSRQSDVAHSCQPEGIHPSAFFFRFCFLDFHPVVYIHNMKNFCEN